MSGFLQLALGVFLFVLSLTLLCGIVIVFVCWIHWLRENKRSSKKSPKVEESKNDEIQHDNI